MPNVFLRSVFIKGWYYDYSSDRLPVELNENEFIINIESIPPNPQVGVGARVWIGELGSE